MSHIDQETPAEEQAINANEIGSLNEVLTPPKPDPKVSGIDPEFKPNCPGSDY